MNLDDLIDAALDEDLGPGDLATEATIAPDAAGRATIVAKEAIVVAGHEVAGRVFERAAARYGGSLDYAPVLADGASAASGDTLARVSGSMRGLLVGERPALNLLMWLSGVATWTRRYADAAAGTGLRIVDTRKTTPLWRSLEKHAVRMGGAHNHRMGLYDGCMIKDNHIAAVGSLSAAVKQARAAVHHLTRIQVECSTLAQVEEALGTAADSLMFDNMDDDTLRDAVALARERQPHWVLEASGMMTPERIAGLGGIGLDVVSAGGLIHQARWVDLSMRVQG